MEGTELIAQGGAEGGLVGGEEDGGAVDLVGAAHAGDGVHALIRLVEGVALALAAFLVHGGVHCAGTNAVEAHSALAVLAGELAGHGFHRALGGGIVDEHIDAAIGFHRRFNGRLHLCALANITDDGKGTVTGSGQFGGEGFEFPGRTGGEGDDRPLGHKGEGDLAAKAFRGTGNEGDFRC